MENASDSIEVAIRDRSAYVRVHGRGTFKVGPSLKEFGTVSMDRGCTRILVDLADCAGMDSTFMGTLAGLAVSMNKSEGALVLRNASDKNKYLIKMLGLATLVKFDEESSAGETMPSVAESLAVNHDKRELTESMIEAHEILIEVAPENIIKFKDVLSFLHGDLKGAAGQKGEGQPTS